MLVASHPPFLGNKYSKIIAMKARLFDKVAKPWQGLQYAALLLLTTLGLPACSSSSNKSTSTEDKLETSSLLFVAGSYGSAEDDAVRLYSFDEGTGRVKHLSSLRGIANPSYVAPSVDGSLLLAVSESDSPNDALYTIRLDSATHEMSIIDSIHTEGAAPCHITQSIDGKHLISANYSGGSITSASLNPQGSIERSTKQVLRFAGKGHHPERQQSAHAHYVTFAPDSTVWVSDLGLDSIHVLRLMKPQATGKSQMLLERAGIKIPKGYGPRHIAFTPDQSRAYVMCELSGAIIGLRQSAEGWQPFTEVQADSLRSGGSADIHVSPDARYLYSSHRLQGDGIAIHRIEDDGTLVRIGYQRTGKHPRNFALSPSGNYLLVACRDSNAIEVYKRDETSGLLRAVGRPIVLPKVTSIRFIKPRDYQ